MRAVVCLNGEPPRPELLEALDGSFVTACDGACDWLAAAGVQPDLVVGDFDSIKVLPEGAEILRYQPEKDYSDGELALNILLERGYDEFVFLGGGGLRDDHFYFNLYLLYRLLKEGKQGVFRTNYNDIYLFDRSFSLPARAGGIVSLAPYFESVHIIRTNGLKYALSERTLAAGESLGVSNVAVSDRFSVELTHGVLLVFVSNQ